MSREKHEMLEKSCPVCDHEDPESIFAKYRQSFVRCRDCGLIYEYPPPPEGESEKYYETDYYEDLGDRTPRIQEARAALFRHILAQCDAYRQTGRLLDVGAGYGDFLEKTQEKGWQTWGIEPSKQACEYAHKVLGLRILNQTVETAEFPENHFDIITLWNVIDCLPDPVAEMRKVNQWLRPGGLLLIRTPNASFHSEIHRFYSRFRFLLEKLGWKKEASVLKRNNFEAKALQKLLHRTGFTNVQVKNGEPTTGDPYQVLSSSKLMAVAKFLIYGAAQLLSFFSFDRLLIGSNLVVHASKEDKSKKVFSDALNRLHRRIFLKSAGLHLLAALGYLLGLPLWRRIFSQKEEVQILLYHNVNPSRKGDMVVSPAQFEKQLDFLKQHCSLRPLEETLQSLKEGMYPRAPAPLRALVAITFDDGYRDNYEFAYPLLEKKKIPATIFLLTGESDSERKAGHLDETLHENRLLSWEEIKKMSRGGIAFGSHGESHLHLKELSSEKLSREMTASKKKIESETEKPVRFFSYPYGTPRDFSQREETVAREAGYEAAFSAIFGTNGLKSDLYALKRMGIEASDSLFTFRAKLNGALDLLRLFNSGFARKLIRILDGVFFKENKTQVTPQGLSRSLKRNMMEGVAPQGLSPTLLVSVDFPPHTDGVSTLARELSERIARRGQEVLVIGPQDEGAKAFDVHRPYQIFRVPGYHWGYLRLIPILLKMPQVVLRRKVRKIFAMNIAYGGVLSWLLSSAVPLEYVLFAYGYEFEKVRNAPLARWLYRKIYHRAKTIVACSEQVRQRLIRFGVRPEKIQVLYPGVDCQKYFPREVPQAFLEKKGFSHRRILLTVGRLVERKGHDQVIKVLPQILRIFPNVLYVLVGIGAQEPKLRGLVHSLGLEEYVRFMGKVPEDELVLLYNACEVFVMPSREISEGGHIEGFGIVYLEANACAKPVIGGDSGGVGEAIRDGETGLLVDPEDVNDLAGKITDLFSHPRKAQELGEQGLKRVRENFDWENYTKQAYEFLNEGGASQ